MLNLFGPRADDGECVSSRGSRRTARRLENTEAGTKPAKWTGEFPVEKMFLKSKREKMSISKIQRQLVMAKAKAFQTRFPLPSGFYNTAKCSFTTS